MMMIVQRVVIKTFFEMCQLLHFATADKGKYTKAWTFHFRLQMQLSKLYCALLHV